jgi:hypothetical protein
MVFSPWTFVSALQLAYIDSSTWERRLESAPSERASNANYYERIMQLVVWFRCTVSATRRTRHNSTTRFDAAYRAGYHDIRTGGGGSSINHRAQPVHSLLGIVPVTWVVVACSSLFGSFLGTIFLLVLSSKNAKRLPRAVEFDGQTDDRG